MRIERLLQLAMAAGATDLHLTAESPATIRVRNEINRLTGEALRASDVERLAHELLDETRLKDFLREGHVRFSHGIGGVGRFRVSIYRQRGTVALALKLVYPGTPSIESLSLPGVIGELALKPRGLVLITGPQGSMKHKVIAAMVDHINHNRKAHVIGIEDPIEHLHKHHLSVVNQREIGTDARDYAEALHSARWQDADVLAIGDIPDLRTFEECLDAAGSACLVIASIRSRGIESSLRSLVGMVAADSGASIAAQIANCVEGIVGLMRIQTETGMVELPLTEVLLGTPAVRGIISERRFHHVNAAIQTGHKDGMHTFEQSVEQLCMAGFLSDAASPILLNEIREHR